jgi:hypothetical protein
VTLFSFRSRQKIFLAFWGATLAQIQYNGDPSPVVHNNAIAALQIAADGNEKVADNNLASLVNAKPSAAAAAAVEFGSSYDNPIDLEDSDFEEENDPPLSAQAENNLTSLTNPKSSVDVSALEILPPDECKHREKRNSRSRLLCKVAGCNTEGRKNQDDMCARHFSMFSSNGVGTCQAAPEARKQSKKRQALKQLECELSSPKNTRSRGTIRRKRGTAI